MVFNSNKSVVFFSKDLYMNVIVDRLHWMIGVKGVNMCIRCLKLKQKQQDLVDSL